MYIPAHLDGFQYRPVQPQLDGWFSKAAGIVKKKVSQVENVAKKSVMVPITASAAVARAAVTGGSISKAFDKTVTQPVGVALKNPGVIQAISFIPGIGKPIAIAASLSIKANALKAQQAQAANDAAQSAALDKEIANTQAQIAVMQSGAAPTASNVVGATSAQTAVAQSTDIVPVATSESVSVQVASWFNKPWGKYTNPHADRFGAERASLMGVDDMNFHTELLNLRKRHKALFPTRSALVGQRSAALHGLGDIDFSSMDWSNIIGATASTLISGKQQQLATEQANAAALAQQKQQLQASTAVQTQSIMASSNVKMAMVVGGIAVVGGLGYMLLKKKGR